MCNSFICGESPSGQSGSDQPCTGTRPKPQDRQYRVELSIPDQRADADAAGISYRENDPDGAGRYRRASAYGTEEPKTHFQMIYR